MGAFLPEAVFHVGEQGVVWASAGAGRLLGRSPEDLIGTRLTAFVHPDDLTRLESRVRGEVLAGRDVDTVEMRVRSAGGDWQWVQARLHPVLDAHGQVTGAAIAWRGGGTTPTSAAGQAFATLAEGTRVLLRSTSESDLLTQMCQAACTVDGYVFAWYGIPVDDANRSVRVAAVGGDDHGYTTTVRVSWGDGPTGQGPAGRALRTGQTQVVRDLRHDDRFTPWRAAAAERGIESVIALPVRCEGRIHGALMVYAATADAFDRQAVELLEYLAADIGYGLARLQAATALAASEQRYRLLAENAMDLVFAVAPDGVITWVSPSIATVLGYDPADVVGRTAAAVMTPENLVHVTASAARARVGLSTTDRSQLVTADGRAVWMEVTTRPMRDDTGAVVGRVLSLKDIDEQVRVQQDLQREVAFDALTGLAKKPLAVDRIQDVLDNRREPSWALLCVGVRGMRAVNQAFTYAAGDEVLRTVAGRLVAAAGAHDRVARIAGDEFVVLLRNVVTDTDAADAAERLLAAARGPVDVGNATVEVSTCIGIATTREGLDAEALVRDATAAMRLASNGGPDRWAFLDDDVAERSRRDLDVQARLRRALADGHIHAWAMPIVSLADGALRGHEALVRWVQPDGTVIAPDRFLDVAERSHLILDIDRTVLAQALDALIHWPGHVHVAVNVSAPTLHTGQVGDMVTTELTRTGTDPARLHLEVTETAVFQATSEVLSAMRALADTGVSWWVDDFGTGYSSIAHLLNLPITGLKLDRGFTAALTSSTSRARGLADGLAGLARGLGLATVAEGIETPEQAHILTTQGWDMGQGWLYGRPTPPHRR